LTARTDICRIYYNRSDIAGKEWSLDFGEGSPELLVGRVVLIGVCGATVLDRGADNRVEPRAWLEVLKVTVTVNEEGVAHIRAQTSIFP
jgi:hypothetical protein